MSVLVIAAHPDDEVLGCGGTIARLAGEGETVHIAILGEGITSRHARREDADLSAIDDLHADSRQAADVLGAASVQNFQFPDNRFDTVPLLEIVHQLESLITRHRPRTVFTQHGGDLNVDHQVTFRATLTATRPLKACPVHRVYSYEVASSSEWAFGEFMPVFSPHVWFDIGATLDRKIEAMQAYRSESRTFPHPRSPEALRAAAVCRGSQAGLPAAEAFALVREIRPV